MKNDFCREAIVAGVLVAGLASATLADPWRQGEPGGLAAPRQMPALPVRERLEPGTAFGSSGGSFRPGVAGGGSPDGENEEKKSRGRQDRGRDRPEGVHAGAAP